MSAFLRGGRAAFGASLALVFAALAAVACDPAYLGLVLLAYAAGTALVGVMFGLRSLTNR